MFKQLRLYRLADAWPVSVDQLAEAIATEPFTPCTATQQRATGWVPPRGEEHGALVECVDGHWIARFVIETKTVPGDAVREKTDASIATVEQTTGRKPGKKEIRDLRDDALNALLPSAFPRRAAVMVWIDPTRRWLVVDAVANSKADEVITSLVRVAGQGFGIAQLRTQQSPQSAMASWLASGDEVYTIPDAFHVERECELKGAGDEPAVIKFARHDLATEEVRQHVLEGKLPTRLALGWQGRVGFTLTQGFDLRKVAFEKGMFELAEKAEPAADRFDADVALATGELGGLLDDLVDALGGEVLA